MKFSKDFYWGSATAAYQVEGGAYQDGKGLSIWDVFCKWDGKIYNHDTGDVSCDCYNNIDKDIKLLKESGQNAYRFSIAWSRILPEGIGPVNEKGIQYYKDLIEKLNENHITPFVTLYHWDLPYELYKKGGWLNRESVEWFVYYTKVVMQYFGDSVTNWITFNEPEIFIGQGYYTGEHAPGLKVSPNDLIVMIHNVLLAHGCSVQTIREQYPDSNVGFAPTGPVGIPYQKEDEECARVAMFDEHLEGNISQNFPTFSYAVFCDPVFNGKYPEWIYEELGEFLPSTVEEDLKIISTEIDFLGCNIYNGATWKSDAMGKPVYIEKEEGHLLTGFNWPVTPKALYYGPKFLYERYGKPIYITENGLSLRNWVLEDGTVIDEERIDFLRQYLREMKKAVQDGVPIKGYFCWSLMDNFEWATGYKERFGLVYVDFITKKRIPKKSFYWYKEVIETNGENL